MWIARVTDRPTRLHADDMPTTRRDRISRNTILHVALGTLAVCGWQPSLLGMFPLSLTMCRPEQPVLIASCWGGALATGSCIVSNNARRETNDNRRDSIWDCEFPRRGRRMGWHGWVISLM